MIIIEAMKYKLHSNILILAHLIVLKLYTGSIF